jgi:energy-coupling factor transporter transmembrane protein EcfT
MRLGAPLSRLHVLTKFFGIIILSFVIIRVMDEKNPDPVMAAFLFVLALLALSLGGVTRWLFRSYMVIIFPMFLFLFLTWVAFTPIPGKQVYFSWPLYQGKIDVGISIAGIAFLGVALLHYFLTKKIARGLLFGLVLAVVISEFTPNPRMILTSLPFLSPYTLILSDQNTIVAGTKVLGYAAMVFMSLMLVMTTRDNELTAALRQARMPYMGRFFLSIVFRTLSLSLMDFETIRQAQVARGISVQQKSIFTILRNMALMSVPLVATMLRRSSEIGDALQVRGFSFERTGQEFLEIQPFRALDGVVLLFLAGLAVAVLGFQLNLFTLIFPG